MSDFLSNFSGDDYKEKMPRKKNKKTKKTKIEPESEIKQENLENQVNNEESKAPKVRKKKRKRKHHDDEVEESALVVFDDPNLIESDDINTTESETPFKEIEEKMVVSDDELDELYEVEIDQGYQKKQRNKKIALIVSGVLVILIGYFIYYQTTHVKMPNFVDKSITDVRKWANENRMEVELKNAYSLKIETSDVIKQGVSPGKKVKKGDLLKFTVSEGPDPEEVIALPDFSVMTENEVKEFIDKNKAENMSLINEYSDKVEKGKFVRVEFSDKEVTAETYRRRDSVNVYFSKGKEVFEKNITVPDFNGKMKSDVEEWAQKNSINMTYEEVDSDKVEEGKVISQNIEKNKKIAKHDKMTVAISIGKAVVVPNYANFSAETSATAVEGLTPTIQQVFSDSVPYGQLISQSIEAGTKLTGKDSKSIDLVYSYGQPYIKSYYGQLNGDIPKFIYDDFNSKGANITYDVYFVDSDQEKGSIVKMSAYNQYIPSNAYITFGISNGRYAGQPDKADVDKNENETEE